MQSSDGNNNETSVIAAPDAVLDELREQHVGTSSPSEKRRQRRTSWVTALTIWLSEGDDRWAGSRAIQVTTVDISRGGLGFRHRQFIHPGTCIRTRFDGLSGKPVVDGIVTHCRHTDGAEHRIGVRFTRAGG